MSTILVKDALGVDKSYANIGTGTPADPFHSIPADFFTEVISGNVPGYSYMKALGEREAIEVSVSGVDIWRGNQLTPAPTDPLKVPTPPAIGEQMTVVSESANDTSAGTGVQQIRIEYLDASGAEQTEDITMNGTTPVNTVATDIRFVNDMYSIAVGANGLSDGNIKIYATADSGLVYNMIYIGGNKSLVPHRMVPAGKQLITSVWSISEAQNKRVAFRIRSTDMKGQLLPGVFCFKGTKYLKQMNADNIVVNDPIPALSIIKVSGWAIQVGAEASCSWWGILKDI